MAKHDGNDEARDDEASIDVQSFAHSTGGLSGISTTSSKRCEDAKVLSRATTQATLAAKTILSSGGTEDAALKTAKAASQATLLQMHIGTSAFEGKKGGPNAFLLRRKIKRQSEVVASMALVSAMNQVSNKTDFDVLSGLEDRSTPKPTSVDVKKQPEAKVLRPPRPSARRNMTSPRTIEDDNSVDSMSSVESGFSSLSGSAGGDLDVPSTSKAGSGSLTMTEFSSGPTKKAETSRSMKSDASFDRTKTPPRSPKSPSQSERKKYPAESDPKTPSSPNRKKKPMEAAKKSSSPRSDEKSISSRSNHKKKTVEADQTSPDQKEKLTDSLDKKKKSTTKDSVRQFYPPSTPTVDTTASSRKPVKMNVMHSPRNKDTDDDSNTDPIYFVQRGGDDEDESQDRYNMISSNSASTEEGESSVHTDNSFMAKHIDPLLFFWRCNGGTVPEEEKKKKKEPPKQKKTLPSSTLETPRIVLTNSSIYSRSTDDSDQSSDSDYFFEERDQRGSTPSSPHSLSDKQRRFRDKLRSAAAKKRMGEKSLRDDDSEDSGDDAERECVEVVSMAVPNHDSNHSLSVSFSASSAEEDAVVEEKRKEAGKKSWKRVLGISKAIRKGETTTHTE